MTRLTVALVLIFSFLVLSAGPALAQKHSPIKCISCHKSAAQILPASHKAYKLDSTGPCFACHKPEGKAKPLGEKVHTVHLQKSAPTMKNCIACHTPGAGGKITFPSRPNMKTTKDRMVAVAPFFASWTTSAFLDNSHQQKGLYCLGCHKDYVDEDQATDTQAQCVQCHGDYDEMIKKTTKSTYENNPHKSHFVDLKCSACHRGHKEFEDSCAKCHSFGYKAPGKKE